MSSSYICNKNIANSPLNIIKATARSLKVDITEETNMKNSNDSSDNKSIDDSENEEKKIIKL